MEKTNRKKREAKVDTKKTHVRFPSNLMIARGNNSGAGGKLTSRSVGGGGMTPAPQRLLERVRKTSQPEAKGYDELGRSRLRNMWTPTPRIIRGQDSLRMQHSIVAFEWTGQDLFIPNGTYALYALTKRGSDHWIAGMIVGEGWTM
jgi:hypothetical protein